MTSGLQRGQLPKPVQQRAQHPEGRLCTWNRSRILLVQNPQMTQQPADISHIETHTPTPRSLQSAVVESRKGLKRSDKQQRYHPGMGMSTAAYSQASNHYPLSHTQMKAPHLHKFHKDSHSSSIYIIHSSTSNRHLHSHMHRRNTSS